MLFRHLPSTELNILLRVAIKENFEVEMLNSSEIVINCDSFYNKERSLIMLFLFGRHYLANFPT